MAPDGRRPMVANDGYELRSIRFQNVRGFENASLRLDRENTVLVGPNNAGKTSALRIIDWLFNGLDDGLARQGRGPDERERNLLVPARVTNKKARRVTLVVFVPDGRHANRFSAEDHMVQLRVRVLADTITVRHGAPERGEPSTSTELGIEFLRNLRRQIGVTYLGSLRDASIESFNAQLKADLVPRVAAKFQLSDQGGRPSVELSKVRDAMALLRETAEQQMAGLWSDIADWVPTGSQSSGTFEMGYDNAQLIDFMVGSAAARISTGEHDTATVKIGEVGAGHQSLIALGLALRRIDAEKRPMVLIEEPEAFLHPSAQRDLARRLFDSNFKVIMTTHSPVVVDESLASDVVLVRNHKIYGLEGNDLVRAQINSALLTGQGSEAVFSCSILLVEGPGDRAFFETIRRRLASVVGAEIVGTMGIVAVGGKARFGPWVRLFEGFADRYTGERPISWLVVSDSADAVSDTIAGLTAGGVTVPAAIRRLGNMIPQYKAEQAGSYDRAQLVTATRLLNSACIAADVPMLMMPIDLEYSALASAYPSSITRMAAALGIQYQNKDELLVRLGSKGGSSKPDDKGKHDWMRSEIASTLTWREFSGDVKDILWKWVSAAADQAGIAIDRPRELVE